MSGWHPRIEQSHAALVGLDILSDDNLGNRVHDCLPAWPLLTTNTKGMLGYSSRADVAADIDAAKAGQAKYIEAINATDVAGVLANDELRLSLLQAAQPPSTVNCVQCMALALLGLPAIRT